MPAGGPTGGGGHGGRACMRPVGGKARTRRWRSRRPCLWAAMQAAQLVEDKAGMQLSWITLGRGWPLH